MSSYLCSKCNKPLQEIGIPPHIKIMQMYGGVVNTGSEGVPEEVKKDPFLYRGFFCPDCKKAFCSACSNTQGEICPNCGKRTLMPAYRPLLKKMGSCFVATATFESADAPEVLVLRRFRDEILLESTAGKGFVWMYYLFSPSVAKLVLRSHTAKNISRTTLSRIVCYIQQHLFSPRA